MPAKSCQKMSRMAIGAALVMSAIVAASNAAFSQQQQNAALPFSDGEQLIYQAEFTRALLRGIDVGELRFTAKIDRGTPQSDKPVVSLTGDAVTKGLLIRLAGSKFHLHVESVVDAQPFTVLRTSSLYEDKRTIINSDAVFDHDAGKAVWTAREKNHDANATTVAFTEPVQDVLTLIYFVRTQNLKAGQPFEVAMIDNGRAYRCVVNVLAGKRLSTAIGRVNTLRLEPAILDGAREVRPRGTLSIWLTDDARHIPVKAEVKATIGTVDIKLKRVSYRTQNVALQSGQR
jgi:hypothetical protein